MGVRHVYCSALGVSMKQTFERKVAMNKKIFNVFAIVALMTVFVMSESVLAQDAPAYECDDRFGQCGTPQQSGGGCGCGGGGSILVNNTDLGDTYQYADDYDDDGAEDPYDNCPFVPNRDQADDDSDGVGTGCDNCPNDVNDQQEDTDGDGIGDACDNDIDGDEVPNDSDLCPDNPDRAQKDTDGDGAGDACDDDMDGDKVVNFADNCPLVPNKEQDEEDVDKFGDACDDDDDNDGFRNQNDNCISVANDQEDSDDDGFGDACDSDMDDDGVLNGGDNCPLISNEDQLDLDRDGLGDVCDGEFCYVVMGDNGGCLDPEDAFDIYSPNSAAMTGDQIRLRLFANRANQPMYYSWSVVKAPSGSNATIGNPVGSASISTPYEYHYIEGMDVVFVPDEPGTYEVKVQATLVWEDEVTGQSESAAEAVTTIVVDGESLSNGGCSTTPVGSKGAGILGMLIPMLFAFFGFRAARSRG
jgi:hypothetical protein